MSNEISLIYESALNTYFIIRNSSGQAWDTAGEAFETWNSMGDYDIALTDKSGSMYLGDIPSALPAGYYTIQKFERVGGSVADTDPCLESEYGYWDGASWIRIPNALQTLDTNVDAILADTGTDGVKIADDAITASKFDESTAFPLKSADASTTRIARTGADGDTLENLSDEIATIVSAAAVNMDIEDEFTSGS